MAQTEAKKKLKKKEVAKGLANEDWFVASEKWIKSREMSQ